MLESLITSQTRIKLLLKFFLNSNTSSYLRGLADEFGESSNAIRIELNRFEEAGLLQSSHNGNKKMYRANEKHPLFNDIHNITLKHVGVDKIIEGVINQLGNVKELWITGEFAKGMDSKIIDLLLVGNDFDRNYLGKLVEKAEKMIKRRIRYMAITPDERDEFISDKENALLVWANES